MIDTADMSIDQKRELAAAAVLEKRRRASVKKYENFSEFCKAAWPLTNTQPLQWNWHLDLICEELTLAFRRVHKRLIINVPPRSSKSTFATIDLPAWAWTMKPELAFVCSSFSGDLATDFAVKRRSLLDSNWYQTIWPEKVKFTSDQNQKTQYRNTKMGECIATSMGGSITGKGGDFLIIDDPVDPKMAFSDVEREAANRDFDSTFRSRLNSPSDGVIIIIMQRTHERDLTGHVLNLEPGIWRQVTIPMEAEENQTITFPLSGRVVERKKDDPLDHKRWTRGWCQSQKAINPYVWGGQYQQRPAPLEGGIIKRNWIQYYKQVDRQRIIDARDEGCQSWDCAFKDKKENAYVAGHLWVRCGQNMYLIARIHEHLDFPKTCDGVRQFSRDFPWAINKYIEAKANGPAVIQALQDEISGLVPVEVGSTDGDKVARLYAVSGVFASLHVWVPDTTECPWVTDLVNEWCTQPNAAYWDDTDAMTQALSKLASRVYGLLDLLKQAQNGVIPALGPAPPQLGSHPPQGAPQQEMSPNPPGSGDDAARSPASTPVGACPSCGCTKTRRSPAGTQCAACGAALGQQPGPTNGKQPFIQRPMSRAEVSRR